jgi:hypothetical protein
MKLAEIIKNTAPGAEARKVAEALLAQEEVTRNDWQRIYERNQTFFAKVTSALRTVANEDPSEDRANKARKLLDQFRTFRP